jgi:pantoate kinase
MKCSIFAPSHITGFFQIIDHPNPLKKGSRGAGVVLDKGVISQVKIKDGNGKVDVKINGKSDPKNSSITYKTIDIIKNQFDLTNKKISIKHRSQIPIGAGFGASAACALGTSLGIVKAMDLPITYNQAGAIAHMAEIEMNSGLGDVIAELYGGMVLRLKEGAPEFGKVDKIIGGDIAGDNALFVISKSLGGIATSEIIGDPLHKRRINDTGRNLLHQLLKKPDPTTFMELSRRFAENTTLMDPEILEIIKVLEDETIGASMAMLGKTAFALSKSPDTSIEDVLVAKIRLFGCEFL